MSESYFPSHICTCVYVIARYSISIGISSLSLASSSSSSSSAVFSSFILWFAGELAALLFQSPAWRWRWRRLQNNVRIYLIYCIFFNWFLSINCLCTRRYYYYYYIICPHRCSNDYIRFVILFPISSSSFNCGIEKYGDPSLFHRLFCLFVGFLEAHDNPSLARSAKQNEEFSLCKTIFSQSKLCNWCSWTLWYKLIHPNSPNLWILWGKTLLKSPKIER